MCLGQANFRLTSIGYVFPGVNIYRHDNHTTGEYLKEPQMKMSSIDPNGTLAIEFNQDMLIPDAIDYKTYEYLFEFKLS